MFVLGWRYIATEFDDFVMESQAGVPDSKGAARRPGNCFMACAVTARLEEHDIIVVFVVLLDFKDHGIRAHFFLRKLLFFCDVIEYGCAMALVQTAVDIAKSVCIDHLLKRYKKKINNESKMAIILVTL